jgi:predicted nucleic acid-binding protein
MFVLDTNILSAIMSARPSPQVAAWIAGQPEDALFTTTICEAEILAGLTVMPEGRRRVALETAAQAIFADDFNGRVLPFDAAAYADIFAARQRAGRPTVPLDLMIAAVARANGAGVVTRDIGGSKTAVSHFSIRGRLYPEEAAAERPRRPENARGCRAGPEDVDMFNPYYGYAPVAQFFLEAFQWHGVKRDDALAFYAGDIRGQGTAPALLERRRFGERAPPYGDVHR